MIGLARYSNLLVDVRRIVNIISSFGGLFEWNSMFKKSSLCRVFGCRKGDMVIWCLTGNVSIEEGRLRW